MNVAATENPPAGYVRLGSLGRPFQLQGGLHFYPLGQAEAQAIGTVEQVFVTHWGMAKLREVRRQGNGIIVYFSTLQQREQVKALVNSALYAPAEALPALAGQYYLELLTDLPVYCNGQACGYVREAYASVGQDLLVVALEQQEYLVPLQADYVRVTDDGVYLDNPPEGLLTPDADAS